jgi:methionyl-tRNA synthetase
MGSFYVTTAIPYVNAEPHLGFALELVQADVLARYHRLLGDDTWFLTGTDENSLTNILAAEREALPVRVLVDRNAEVFRALTSILGISNDDFIRTAADPRHRAGARRLWEACAAAGDVYRRMYHGLYCVRCEAFYAPDELLEGRCPDHDVAPDDVEEENYFFRLSRYADRLAALLDSGALRVLPASRHREIRAFVAQGLQDFSISRSQRRARGWGVPVPGDPDQVMYVWFDALANYVTALGYGGDDIGRLRRSWLDNPRRVHVIGKDIVRFHAVYWPAMLLSAGLPPPALILIHGFLTHDGRKMSKTRGTGVDPSALVQSWGMDAVRYWLLHEVPVADDADYSDAGFARVYAADLANDLGNLLQRTASMMHRYRSGVVPASAPDADSPLARAVAEVRMVLERTLDDGWDPRAALDAIFAVVRQSNRRVDDTRPWTLARNARDGDSGAARALDATLWELAEALRVVAEALRPFLPEAAARIASQLGVTLTTTSWTGALAWGVLRPGTRVAPPAQLFPRRELRGP